MFDSMLFAEFFQNVTEFAEVFSGASIQNSFNNSWNGLVNFVNGGATAVAGVCDSVGHIVGESLNYLNTEAPIYLSESLESCGEFGVDSLGHVHCGEFCGPF